MNGADSLHSTADVLTAAPTWRTADAELAAAERDTRESFRTYRHVVDTEASRARELWDRHIAAALRLHTAEGAVETALERLKEAARALPDEPAAHREWICAHDRPRGSCS